MLNLVINCSQTKSVMFLVEKKIYGRLQVIIK